MWRNYSSERTSALWNTPLARGSLVIDCWRQGRLRNTPARAGPAPLDESCSTPISEHPCPCGACGDRVPGSWSGFGTPLPVRCLRDSSTRALHSGRIAHARAGPVVREHLHHSRIAEHLRSCGACRPRRWPEGWCRGTPPPVRGLLPPAMPWVPTSWNTPARAGPVLCRLKPCLLREHPRPCWACVLSPEEIVQIAGPPPPVRGLPVRAPLPHLRLQNTPVRGLPPQPRAPTRPA